MKYNEKYQIWSMTSQGYMLLKGNEDGSSPRVTSSGDGSEPWSKITSTRNESDRTPGENSHQFVFENGGRRYRLCADTSSDEVSVEELTESTSATTVAFVPVTFAGGPFKALKLSNSMKCIASKSNGSLSLKDFNRVFPHPDTVFVITEA